MKNKKVIIFLMISTIIFSKTSLEITNGAINIKENKKEKMQPKDIKENKKEKMQPKDIKENKKEKMQLEDIKDNELKK